MSVDPVWRHLTELIDTLSDTAALLWDSGDVRGAHVHDRAFATVCTMRTDYRLGFADRIHGVDL